MPRRMQVNCPNCRMPVQANIEAVIDPARDPNAKVRLLSNQLNVQRCPNCGATFQVSVPILYHDASKELLISYIPVEVGLPKNEQEKAVGDLMRELTSQIPQEAMRGYFFNPRSALTMQGLIDTILQADGVTPEMMEGQRQRVRLIETLLQTPEEMLQSVIQQNDALIDTQFMQTLTLMAQRMAGEGRMDIAQALVVLQELLLQNTSFGQDVMERAAQQEATVQAVAADLQAFGNTPTRADLIGLAVNYGDDDEQLQALVGLVRPLMDYQFFQDLTVQIGQAPAAERETMESVRDRLLDLIALVDQQAQAAVGEATQMLQILVNSPDADSIIAENATSFDDVFMNVLQANIQQAERQANIQLSARLKDVYSKIVGVLRENMQPELKFINDLLAAPSDAEAKTLISEQAPIYGPQLLEMMDAVGELMASRGETAIQDRLTQLRPQVEQMLA